MSMRPKRQLIESPTASLNASSTSPSIASTVPMASPSIRRSARIQDSPSISYRDSLRGSVLRDTPIRQLGRRRSRSRSRSRIFGLDASDQSRLDKNSDSEMEEEGKEINTMHPYQKLFMEKVIPILTSPRGKGVAASLLLLFMLVFTQWVVGQGVTSIVSWVVGPLSGLRVALMSLPDIVLGSMGRKVEVNEMELLVKLLNNDMMKELIEIGLDERMWEMGKDVDKKLRKEVDIVNREVENVRKMYLDTEIRRLALREEELKVDKIVQQVGGEADDGVEVGQDLRQKLELVEVQVEQLKLSLGEFSKQLSDKREVVSWEEEMGILRRDIEELANGGRNIDNIERQLGIVQDGLVSIGDRFKAVDILNEEVKTLTRQQEEKDEVQNDDKKIMVKEVVRDILADPLNDFFANTCDQQGKEIHRLESIMADLEVALNQTEEKLGKYVREEVGEVKIDLKDEFTQHTESLLSSWSELHANSSVSLPQVSAMLESQLSLFSADRTGLVDWASLSLGGSIVSTPHTTTHPMAGQELTVLGWPVWQVSSSPSKILQPVAGPGQCWAFSGQAGQVVMQLGKVVTVTGVTIEHVRPSPDISSAPRDMVVWDHVQDAPLLNMTYSIASSSSSVQTFPLLTPITLSKLRLEVASNWGNEKFTCLYRVRIHGTQEEDKMRDLSVTKHDDTVKTSL